MKITKRQLRSIIKEERAKLLSEQTYRHDPISQGEALALKDAMQSAYEEGIAKLIDMKYDSDDARVWVLGTIEKIFQEFAKELVPDYRVRKLEEY
jgi:hypothetical protein